MSPFARPDWYVAAALLLAAPALGEAQVLADSVRLQGRVVEAETRRPIGFAELTLLDRDLRRIRQIQTGRDGRFNTGVSSKEPGVYIRAERIGYEATRTPFLWFDDKAVFELELSLAPDAVLLAPLEVVASVRRTSVVLEGFRQRVESGLGHYITREQIEDARPRQVTDLLAHIPGVQLRSSGSGMRRIVQMSRSQSVLTCPAQVYVDGMRLNSDYGPRDTRLVAIDDYVSPGSVEGIEVYRGLSTVPASFLNEYAKCGVVVIWTRRGS